MCLLLTIVAQVKGLHDYHPQILTMYKDPQSGPASFSWNTLLVLLLSYVDEVC